MRSKLYEGKRIYHCATCGGWSDDKESMQDHIERVAAGDPEGGSMEWMWGFHLEKGIIDRETYNEFMSGRNPHMKKQEIFVV